MTQAAQPQDKELKPHGDELENALKPAGATQKDQPQQPAESGTKSKE